MGEIQGGPMILPPTVHNDAPFVLEPLWVKMLTTYNEDQEQDK